jgi:cystathionine beta-lyase
VDRVETATVTELPNPFEVYSLAQLRERTSVKWRQFPEMIPLWVAEMDVDIAEPIKAALRHAIDISDTGYPHGNAYGEAFVEFALRHWGWTVDVANTVPAIDVMTGVTHAISALSPAGAPVIITTPVYGPFKRVVEHLDRPLVTAPLSPAGRLDLDTLSDALEAHSGVGAIVLLSNPHNPTGAAHTRAELEAVAGLARTHGARIIADEIHAPVQLGDSTFVPMCTVAGAENAVSVFSASKAFNLAGLKAALISAGPEAGQDVGHLRAESAESTSHFGVIAHVAAMRHGDEWLAATLAALTDNRALLQQLVTAHLPGAKLIVPEATYLAWVDASALELPQSPAAFFRDNAGIAFSDGDFFVADYADHFRVNFATSPVILTEAFERAGQAFRRQAVQRR